MTIESNATQRERKQEENEMLNKNDLRVGSVLRDLNGSEHTVIRIEDVFIITTYGNGENWLVESHLEYETLVKY